MPNDPLVKVITSIDLNDVDIVGYLLVELNLLIDITSSSSTLIASTISSPKISRLKLLHELDANNNRFVGPFPNIALHLLSIKYLNLWFNDFEGVQSLILFDKELDVIFLNDDHFSSQVSDNFGNSKTFVVIIANNKIHGCLSSSIGKMAATLNELILTNKFSRFNQNFLLPIGCSKG
ncbi:leucine-rich repeat extensin-like protein 7 [Musa acuminata AAA Group]